MDPEREPTGGGRRRHGRFGARNRLGAVAVLVVLTAGCGSTTPGGVAPRGGVTSLPGLGGGLAPVDPLAPGPDRSTLPVAPATQRFLDRAALVAQAVRRTGVPQASTEPLLLSGWALDEGFDTVEQKVAWANGQVSFARSVDLTASGSGTLRLPDGASRRVEVLGAAPSLDRALGGALGAPVACTGVDEAACHLVVTRAERTDVALSTSRGPGSGPAWRLTIAGLGHTISVLAVPDGVLHAPQQQEDLPGLPQAWFELHALDSARAVSGRTVEVGISGGGCDEGLVAHVVELDDMVIVGGTAPPPPKDAACTLEYASRPAQLRLARPLGSRPLIDVVSGRARVVGVPVL